jgi:hypothetical protein
MQPRPATSSCNPHFCRRATGGVAAVRGLPGRAAAAPGAARARAAAVRRIPGCPRAAHGCRMRSGTRGPGHPRLEARPPARGGPRTIRRRGRHTTKRAQNPLLQTRAAPMRRAGLAFGLAAAALLLAAALGQATAEPVKVRRGRPRARRGRGSDAAGARGGGGGRRARARAPRHASRGILGPERPRAHAAPPGPACRSSSARVSSRRQPAPACGLRCATAADDPPPALIPLVAAAGGGGPQEERRRPALHHVSARGRSVAAPGLCNGGSGGLRPAAACGPCRPPLPAPPAPRAPAAPTARCCCCCAPASTTPASGACPAATSRTLTPTCCRLPSARPRRSSAATRRCRPTRS